jgi:polyisoprenyl-phosphate glycosyltransferase
MKVAVVVPVTGAAAALRPFADRLAAALADRDWRLRLVIDAAGEESVREAHALAAGDHRIAVTGLTVRAGRPGALAAGLAAEPAADVWVCLDGESGDPPEAVPLLLDRLDRGDVAAVFAGPGRGLRELLRAVVTRVAGLPPVAGAFVAVGRQVRDTVVDARSPLSGAAAALAGRPVAAVPVTRERRAERPGQLAREARFWARELRRRSG